MVVSEETDDLQAHHAGHRRRSGPPRGPLKPGPHPRVFVIARSRVARAHCCARAPSEPAVPAFQATGSSKSRERRQGCRGAGPLLSPPGGRLRQWLWMTASVGCGPGGGSDACVAVKILCRSRRTSSSTRRHSTAPQSTTSPSGPFTVTVSNVPIGSGVSVHLASSQTHLTHVGALSGRASARIRPVIAGTIWRRCQRTRPRVPVAFRPSAFASWVILRPLGS